MLPIIFSHISVSLQEGPKAAFSIRALFGKDEDSAESGFIFIFSNPDGQRYAILGFLFKILTLPG